MVEPVYPHYRQGKKPRQIRRERRGSLDLGPEDVIQCDFITWVDFNKKQHPALDLIFAVPNAGFASPKQGALRKMTGRRAGVPDIFVAVPTMSYAPLPLRQLAADDSAEVELSGVREVFVPGFFIEFKEGNKTPTKEQKAWHVKLKAHGYRVEIYRSWMSAANAMIEYLNLPLEKIPE